MTDDAERLKRIDDFLDAFGNDATAQIGVDQIRFLRRGTRAGGAGDSRALGGAQVPRLPRHKRRAGEYSCHPPSIGDEAVTRDEAKDRVVEAVRKYHQTYSQRDHDEMAKALALYDSTPDSEGGWRPIDDAARNADCDWLLGTTESDFTVVAFWDDSKDDFQWQTADGPGYRAGAFTHYRPLPTPPSQEQK